MLFKTNHKGKSEEGRKNAYKTLKDRISAYMIGELDELEPAEEKIMNRWLAIWQELENGMSPSQAVKAHVEKYEAMGMSISRRTAYMDLKAATELWGSFQEIGRRAQLVLLHELAMKTFQSAVTQKDVTEMNRAVNNLKNILELYEPYEQDEETPRKYVLQIGLGDKLRTFDLDKLHDEKKSDYHAIIDAMESEEMGEDEMRKLLGDGN